MTRLSGALIVAVMATAVMFSITSAATTQTWTAPLGSGEYYGSATFRAVPLTSGFTYRLGLSLRHLRPSTVYSVAIRKGTCATTGSLLATVASIRTGSTGTASRTSVLTSTQGHAIRAALLVAKAAIRVGARCTTFAPIPTPKPTPTPTPTPTPSPTPPSATIDGDLQACPTTGDVAAVQTDLALTFDGDPSAGTFVCSAGAGSADLTQLQAATYHSILAMKLLTFDAPLPWTSRSLYSWFIGAVRGVHVTSTGTYSSCCEPGPTITIVVQSNFLALLTGHWIDPQLGGGLADYTALLIHEARHAEGYPHTCGTNDATLAEMGAWGVEYYYYSWLALHTDPAYMRGTNEPWPGYYTQIATGDANSLLSTRFCSPS